MADIHHPLQYDDHFIDDILNSVKTIAVVGASPQEDRVSHQIMLDLMAAGYDVIPVNPRPGLDKIANVKVYPNLAAIDRPVDMVDVFRKPEHLMAVAEEAIAIGAKVLWGQLEVIDHDAAKYAEDRGLKVIMDRCPKIELMRMGKPARTKTSEPKRLNQNA